MRCGGVVSQNAGGREGGGDRGEARGRAGVAAVKTDARWWNGAEGGESKRLRLTFVGGKSRGTRTGAGGGSRRGRAGE